MQLGLTESAHIVPITHPKSTDETSNGICLCALHHAAYDKGLILLKPDYAVEVSSAVLADLARSKLAEGKEAFVRSLNAVIRLPPEASLRPRPEYLHIGLQLRRAKYATSPVP